ncbi:MAG: M16 family metallopeptidase [Candidatus Nitrospinota bacterium M3_3B_026]
MIRAVAAFSLSLAAAALLSCAAPGAGKEPSLAELEYPPIKTRIPETKRVTLSNGMTVHLLPDRELPVFNVAAMIRVGARWEPEDKAGLASLTGAAIRSGGTKTLPPEDLDERLEMIGGSVETSIGEESGSAMLSVLSRDIGVGLELFADVIRNPAFDEDRLELARARMLDSIRRQNDDPQEIASRELRELLYAGTPYGRTPTTESVKSITREDVMAFHEKYFVPQNFILGVTGDFDEEKIIARLEEVFAGWSGPDPEYPAVEPAKEKGKGGVYVAEKSLGQSVIRMGHLALRRTDPDYFAFRVMNHILGGSGFSSRLVKTVRTDHGLAYSVWSYHFGGRMEIGSVRLGAETKTGSTAKTIRLMLEEARRIREEKVIPEELKRAKDSIVNSFIFIFDTPQRLMSQRLTVDYYDYPDDYLETYRDRIMEVNAEDVLRVAREYLRPGALKIVVVGDQSGFDKPLSEFGEVESIELEDLEGAGVS